MNDIVTADDLAQLRAEYFVSLDSFSDEELTAALLHDDAVLACGRQWGWNDAEARDMFSRCIVTVTGRDVD